jgi:hypothetical protein
MVRKKNKTKESMIIEIIMLIKERRSEEYLFF